MITYWMCNNCTHTWRYNDTNCPECGSIDFEDLTETI